MARLFDFGLSPQKDLSDGAAGTNAALLFPSLVASYRALDDTKSAKSSLHIPATDTFDIVAIIVGYHTWQAFITYTTADGVKQAAASDEAHTLVEALQGLLSTTAYALCKQSEKGEVLAGFEGYSTRFEYGSLDQDLLEGVQDE
ncbi:hypothetical protein LTR56_005261 [Elasticomyces elasticus]|nr:hypothetical protein LTR56_005261 [Elasticomyces elasticus]KAK3656471.1 hypothetical protein LTR22_009744 [Elasticomyces elasticus]KAK4923637.1 hypothetical protein LTR49_009192 [Elasticomyces elasticus]KAK5762076.1 hypothetical protein LTS12_007773 [Elasticomyces elasticus]